MGGIRELADSRPPFACTWCGYSADLDVFPVDRRIASVVAGAVRVRGGGRGAHVEPVTLGLTHDRRELSDFWSRLIMPANIGVVEGLGLFLMRTAAFVRTVAGCQGESSPSSSLYWRSRSPRSPAPNR
jgi:hypothetical protein